MDARYNDFMDSVKWRITLNLAGFALWLGLAVALIAAGAK
jgi:hypothetical protein